MPKWCYGKSVNDLSTTCQRPVNDLSTTCQRPVNDLSTTCQRPVNIDPSRSTTTVISFHFIPLPPPNDDKNCSDCCLEKNGSFTKNHTWKRFCKPSATDYQKKKNIKFPISVFFFFFVLFQGDYARRGVHLTNFFFFSSFFFAFNETPFCLLPFSTALFKMKSLQSHP